MNTKVILIVGGLAVLIASLLIDTRLTPFVGAALLLGVLIYGWAANRAAGEESRRKADRATRRQKANHTGPRS